MENGKLVANRPVKLAIPVTENKRCTQLENFNKFVITAIVDDNIEKTELLVPPDKEPAVIADWLASLQVTTVIACGMTEEAQGLLAQQGMEIICEVAPEFSVNIIFCYLEGTLETGPDVHCDEDEHHCCH